MFGIDDMALAAGGAALISYVGGQQTNAANARIAENQMNFQERMSNTSHQREMADLQASGLNPLLSARYGGSSTPPGATAVMHNPVPSAVQAGTDFYRASLEGARNPSVIQTTDRQGALYSAEYNKVIAEAARADEERWLVAMQQVETGVKAIMYGHTSTEIQRNTELLNVRIDIAKQELKTAKIRGEVSESDFGLAMEYLDRLPGAGGFLGGAAGSAVGSLLRKPPVYNNYRLPNFNSRNFK